MKPLENLDWEKLTHHYADLATSYLAKDKLKNMQPFLSEEQALVACQSVQDFQRALEVLEGRPYMESLDLFNPWFSRLEKHALLKFLELKDIRLFCIETLALKESLKDVLQNSSNDVRRETSSRHNSIKDLHDHLMAAEEPLSAIDQIITPQGEIRSDASELLYKLFHEKKEKTILLKNRLDKLVKKHELENLLQDRYVTNREGRWVLPIISGKQHEFMGIIHDSSHSKQTVFMEPEEIVPINNRLREVENEIDEEIERLLTELSHYLASKYSDFAQTKDQLLRADIEFAKAQVSQRLEAHPFQFSPHSVELKELRHPLLVLNQNEVISNDVELLPDHRVLILSGPNAGGKTVLLKALGLAAQMTRCGLPICAQEGSQIPFFKEIFVSIGDAQSVDENLSTFAAHLKLLNVSLEAKGPSHLLLIDEICGSTDPEEGSALAKSFIENYAKNQVFAVITSHLSPLKYGWSASSGVMNGSLEFDKEKGPTYQFLKGVPGQSLALQTALRVGVRSDILEKAKSFLSPESKAYQQSLEEIEKIKKEVLNLRQALQEKIRGAEKQKLKYETELHKLNEEKQKIINDFKKKTGEAIDTWIQEEKVRSSFQKHSHLQNMKEKLPDVIKATPSSTTPSNSIETAEEFSKKFPPGSKVFYQPLGTEVLIHGEPNQRGEVPIISNSMRLFIPWKELKRSQNVNNPTREILRKSGNFQVQLTGGMRNVDLRGMNLDDALEKLELQLDTAALQSEDRIKVIHGFGTEVLKRGIRNYLSKSLYVKKWQAGNSQTGGDGVTWAELNH